jgi:hypothetical protein
MKNSTIPRLITLAILACLYQGLGAQDLQKCTYKTAIGVKYAPFGVTFKTFTGTSKKAIELIGYFKDGFQLAALYEFHGVLNSQGNLKWYVGPGIHGGYFDNESDNGVTFGIDAVLGLDYKFCKLPINLSLDWQPRYEFITPGTEFQGGQGGLSVRIAL